MDLVGYLENVDMVVIIDNMNLSSRSLEEMHQSRRSETRSHQHGCQWRERS
ncbi:hypothetical protein MtrunA17_Chr4g0031261 [Medicago truncatula]|uniref:Uncharacterized protein n=1 Tax=Medicago truncatula TaxID=3880 RepID=A0A396I860_MEDTR|nr:hypothetical protein MtrunA17_Chr4g0031261 [Medicago truncatula]